MNRPTKLPWHRRRLPWWMPPWLPIGLLAAGAGGFFATYIHDYTAGAVAAGLGVGLFAGLAFCLFVAGRATPETAPDVALFRPPEWLARPVLVGVLVLAANGAFNRAYREFHSAPSATSSRGRHLTLRGPVAALVGCALLAVAGYSCVAAVGRPRATSSFVGGLLGAAVLVAGLGVIVTRLWDRPT